MLTLALVQPYSAASMAVDLFYYTESLMRPPVLWKCDTKFVYHPFNLW